MSYSLLYTLQLGSKKANLGLSADLLDPNGSIVASGISASFIDLGFGNYIWYYDQFPNHFRGVAKIYDSAIPSGWNLPLAINPEELSAYIGENIVTITAEDNSGNPIGGATVEIRPSGSIQSPISYGKTSTYNGRIVFNLSDGKYDVYGSKTSMYHFTNPYHIDVSGGSNDVTITATAMSVPVAPAAGLVRIYTFLSDLGLEPKANVKMLVTPSGLQDIDEELIITKKGLSAVSDNNGYVYMDVAAEFAIRVKIPDANYDQYIMTPSIGILNLAEVID